MHVVTEDAKKRRRQLLNIIVSRLSSCRNEVETPRLGMRRSSPTNGDLSQALQLLDEETMSQACSLLISEHDYGDDVNKNGNGCDGADYDKLLTIFVKCRDAALKVEQQMPTMPLPNLLSSTTTIPPPTSATTPSARAAAKKAHLMNAMSPPRRIHQKMARINKVIGESSNNKASSGNHRAGKTTAGGPAGTSSRPSLKREPSDSSIASSSSTSSRASVNKKARTSTNSAPPPSEGKKAAAPPQAALNFLQALNSQKKENREVAPAPSATGDKSNDSSAGRTPRARAAKHNSGNSNSSTTTNKPPTKGKRSSPRTRE